MRKIFALEYLIEKFQPYEWKYSCMMRKITLNMKKMYLIVVEDEINGAGEV